MAGQHQQKESMANQLGQRLRQSRISKGLSQRELGRLAGVDKSYLSKLENNRAGYPPSLQVLESLAKHLGLDLKDLRDAAGRLSPEALEDLQGLTRAYPSEMAAIFRRLKADPTEISRWLRH